MEPDYKKLYFSLFNCLESAIRLLENREYVLAWQCLVQAQREAEERYLESGD